MASSASSAIISHHVRSNSLPSKPHPAIAQVDERLRRLRASSDATTSSSSSVSQKLSCLRNLHDGVDELLLLPTTRLGLARETHDELLEGSLRILDLCDAAKDALLQTKEFTYNLQSILRRRRGGEMGFAGELKKCLALRKSIKKTISKSLKEKQSKNGERKPESMAVVGLLRDVEAVTFETVKSLLSFIAGGSKLPLKATGWPLVSKLVRSNRVACCDDEGESISTVDEVAMLDSAICSIITAGSHKTTKSDSSKQVQNLQISLAKFESNIQDLEENLNNLCRKLIRTRVSLLNILND